MAGLAMYLLDRERLHWSRLYRDRPEPGYRTQPEVMSQAVFVAALTGTVARDAGRTVLTKLQLPDPAQILSDHAVCYPPADPGDQMVLEPLYPDRLAEDFLALTVPGHAADYPAQDWAVPTSTALLARDGDASTPATWTARAVTFLASAAHRWSHLGPGQLYPLLRDAIDSISEGTATRLDSTAEFIRDFSVVNSLRALVRRSPGLALGIGAGAGLLVGLALRRAPARGRPQRDVCAQLRVGATIRERRRAGWGPPRSASVFRVRTIPSFTTSARRPSSTRR